MTLIFDHDNYLSIFAVFTGDIRNGIWLNVSFAY